MAFYGDFVVQGMTMEGEVFEPQDWAEQLCAEIEKAGQGGLPLVPTYLYPVVIGGVRSLVVLSILKEADPKAFEMITRYVVEHHLVVRAGRGGTYIETTGVFPAYGQERRDSSHDN